MFSRTSLKMPAQRRTDVTTWIAILTGSMFLALALESWFGVPLRQYGILPRTRLGLMGVLTAPLLHASWGHLLANAVPFVLLLTLLLANRDYRGGQTLALIWLVSGVGTWLIGRGNAVHIGASSLVFGMVAFLIVAGIRVGSWRAVLVAILVFALFGGIFYGVLPNRGPISWEGHLCGAASGVWAAFRLRQR